jgi:hypothetical protein
MPGFAGHDGKESRRASDVAAQRRQRPVQHFAGEAWARIILASGGFQLTQPKDSSCAESVACPIWVITDSTKKAGAWGPGFRGEPLPSDRLRLDRVKMILSQSRLIVKNQSVLAGPS